MIRVLIPYLFILPAFFYSFVTLFFVCAFFKRKLPGEGFSPPISIVKPLKGMDSSCRQNLESFCNQNYPLVQIVFVLQSSADPCIPIIRQLMADYQELDIELVIDAAIHGTNGKVSNLINAFPHLKHDIIAIADSDIRVETAYLAHISAYFSAAEVGLVTSLYRGLEVGGMAAAIEALGYTAEMIPNVIVAERLEGLSFGLGASLAVRRKALASIGGFGSLADYLADDYQLGNMIARAGWKVVLSGDIVESVMQRENLAAVFSRQLRWCRTMRVSRPFGYLASGVTQPFLALAVFFASAGFSPATLTVLVFFYLVRSSILIFFSRAYVMDNLLPRYLWLLPFRDALAALTWALSFVGNRVIWRGESYDLRADGKMLRKG